MKKITYILANIDKAIAFEWIADSIDKNKYQLSFILLHKTAPYLFHWLTEKEIEAYYLPHKGKKSYPENFIKIIRLLKKIKPDVVHCHLLDANILGLSAAKLTGIKKRIYTRHHATFHHQYHPQAVKYDKFCNFLATDIVAISKNVQEVLIKKEHAGKHKIHLIHHGFDLDKFQHITPQKIDALKHKYGLTDTDYPVIGVIARYIKLKGHRYIIDAFQQVLNRYPQAKLVLANASGPDKTYIRSLLSTLPEKSFIEIPFEQDLFTLYQLFDVYVHTPVNEHIEAFGQTYIEALAAGIPSVFTLSGVANECIKNNENALVVPFKNSKAIAQGIIELLENKPLAQSLSANGKLTVKAFSLENFIKKLEKLYS